MEVGEVVELHLVQGELRQVLVWVDQKSLLSGLWKEMVGDLLSQVSSGVAH